MALFLFRVKNSINIDIFLKMVIIKDVNLIKKNNKFELQNLRKKMQIFNRLLIGFSLMILSLTSLSSYAQETESSGIEEIIVTARQ